VPHGEIGEQWPDECPGGSARRNEAEQPLRLRTVEELEKKAPEHRHQHQVQHADPDIEDRADRDVFRA